MTADKRLELAYNRAKAFGTTGESYSNVWKSMTYLGIPLSVASLNSFFRSQGIEYWFSNNPSVFLHQEWKNTHIHDAVLIRPGFCVSVENDNLAEEVPRVLQ